MMDASISIKATSKANANTNGDNDIHLECGTSLAEMEYTSEVQEQERQSEEQTKGRGNAPKKEPNSNIESLSFGNPSSSPSSMTQDIQTIRSALAKDVVTSSRGEGNGNGYSTFTSPFETPHYAHQATGHQTVTRDTKTDRYVSVPMVYCDQTASNRPLSSVEHYIQETCLPLYGNTHTNTSVTGSQSTAFVAEARQIVAEGVNAKITGKAALDVVLFA